MKLTSWIQYVKFEEKINNPCLYKVTAGDTFETQLKGGLEDFNPLVRDLINYIEQLEISLK